MQQTPYAYDFLWNQIELGFQEIRKPAYRKLVEQFLFDPEIRKKVEKLPDKTGRKYEGGLLEKTASVLSLSLCMYDNYPEIDIDLILTGIILSLLCKAFTKKECFNILKSYPDIIPFIFKKNRKKPSLELTVFDGIQRLDNKIILKLMAQRERTGGEKMQ
ncbi:hypothetical protein [Persephonella sp. KM09-Lau-8]|uniref:hypothetical protein n=1 Tax=Persephonella sp. KM09-Lau-8 TaxID=1158345 RepID=UPI000497DE26|nr:hypothetical protein [Persephonella sp. KM09-Lau-8]